MCGISAISSDEKLGMGALYFIESMRDADYYGMDMLQPIMSLLIGLSDGSAFLYVVCIDNSDVAVKYSKDGLTIKWSGKTVKLGKEDAYDIMRQMDLKEKQLFGPALTRVKADRTDFLVSSSTLRLEHDRYQIIKKHFIGRLMNIHEWPRQAIELWAGYYLCLNHELLQEVIKTCSKKEMVRLSQKYFTYKARVGRSVAECGVMENPCHDIGYGTATNTHIGSTSL